MNRGDRYRDAEARLFRAAGIEPVEHRVTLPAVGVGVRVLEVGQGPAAVFFTGGPNAAATFTDVAANLADRRCLLVDRPGTGLSDPLPATLDADGLRAYAARLPVDVLDALGLDRAPLVASSLGGYLSLRAAAEHPDRVERVVLLGYPAFAPGWQQPRFFTLLRTPVVRRLVLAMPATRAGARSFYGQMGHRRSLAAGRISGPMIDWTVAWQRDTGTMRNDAAVIDACGTRRGGFDPRLDLGPADLAAVRAPCLIVVGTDDPVGGADEAHALASQLPEATVHVREGAGHLPWLDDPVAAAAAIEAFLAGSPAGPGQRDEAHGG